MSETIKLELHNNETSLPKGKRMLLAFPHPALVPCTVTEGPEDFSLEFNVDGLVCLAEQKDRELLERYRLLYNCAALRGLTEEFHISLTPENVYLDVNLEPKLLRRDVGKTPDEQFLAEYKALIGSVLDPKYSFEDYFDGGADLYKRKALREICLHETLEEVAAALLESYQKELQHQERDMTRIGKRQLTGYRVMAPVLLTITALCVAAAVYLYFFALPFAQKLIRGNNAYLSSDYLSVQEELQSIDVSKLPDESKYILARSYVVSEGLSSAQKENILSGLTPKTDAVYFDYWIELGRLNFDSAIDVAQRIGDEQLLLLAYIKYEAFLETDTYSLSGDEKAEKLQGLRGQIENLTAALEKEREAAMPSPSPTVPVSTTEDADEAQTEQAGEAEAQDGEAGDA